MVDEKVVASKQYTRNKSEDKKARNVTAKTRGTLLQPKLWARERDWQMLLICFVFQERFVQEEVLGCPIQKGKGESFCCSHQTQLVMGRMVATGN